MGGVKKAAGRLLIWLVVFKSECEEGCVVGGHTQCLCLQTTSKDISLKPGSQLVTHAFTFYCKRPFISPVHCLGSCIQYIDVYQWGGGSRRQVSGNTRNITKREGDFVTSIIDQCDHQITAFNMRCVGQPDHVSEIAFRCDQKMQFGCFTVPL